MERIRDIDLLKGIGIVLVVLGHSSMPKFAEAFIFSFHMPLFFFLSGFLFAKARRENFYVFLKKKIASLIVPYCAFGLIMFFALSYSGIGAYGGLYGFFMLGNGFDSVLWFLAHLFVLQIVMFKILSFSGNKKKFLPLMAVSFLLVGILSSYIKFSMFWHIEIIGLSGFFYILGYAYSDNMVGFLRRNGMTGIMGLLLSISFVCGSVWLNLYLNMKHVDLNSNFIGNPILFLSASLFGILLCFFVKDIFLKNIYAEKIITFIGKNSLIILCVHQMIPIVLKQTYVDFGIPQTGIVHKIFVVLAIWFCIYIINNYLYFLIGRKKPLGANL